MPGAKLYSNPDALHASQMLNQLILQADGPANHHSIHIILFLFLQKKKKNYFIVSSEINVYLVKIKVVSITSEMISYHFTIVTDTIYIFTPRFGRLWFSS